MNLNDILSDPKLLIENKELVLDLYNQLKNDKTEQNYKMMLGIHQKNSERLIQTSEVIIDRWANLAELLKKQKEAENLKVARNIFLSAIELAKNTTYNVNITSVIEGATELGGVLSRLFKEAQEKPDTIAPLVPSINKADESWKEAAKIYTDYWNTEFKSISDKWQIMRMIHEAVVNASDSNGVLNELIKKRDKLEKEITDLNKQYSKLLKEWTQELSPDRDLTFSQELIETFNKVKSKKSELSKIEKELDSNQSVLKNLLRDFGIE